MCVCLVRKTRKGGEKGDRRKSHYTKTFKVVKFFMKYIEIKFEYSAVVEMNKLCLCTSMDRLDEKYC